MCNARYMVVYPLTPVLYPSSFEVSVFFDTAFGFYSAQCKQHYLESLLFLFFVQAGTFSLQMLTL